MSAKPPVPCDDACLAKFFLDNSGNGARLQDITDDAKHMHQSAREGKCKIPQAMLDELPGLIDKTNQIHELVTAVRVGWRKGLGYPG